MARTRIYTKDLQARIEKLEQDLIRLNLIDLTEPADDPQIVLKAALDALPDDVIIITLKDGEIEYDEETGQTGIRSNLRDSRHVAFYLMQAIDYLK